jgi:hypothetical protein
MKCRLVAVFVLALALLLETSWATTVSIGASKDTTLFSNDPTNSDGGGPGLFVGKIASGSGVRRSLLEFNIAASVRAG